MTTQLHKEHWAPYAGGSPNPYRPQTVLGIRGTGRGEKEWVTDRTPCVKADLL